MTDGADTTQDGPREPPEIARRLRFHRLQLVGVPLLALIPLLALAGVFGHTVETTARVEGDVAVVVEHPARFRYKQIAPLDVVVENVSDRALDLVEVHVDPLYLDAFSQVSFTPSPPRAYDFRLEGLAPGERRRISGSVQAERFGVHEGEVVVEIEGDRVVVPLRTLSLP